MFPKLSDVIYERLIVWSILSLSFDEESSINYVKVLGAARGGEGFCDNLTSE